MVKLEWNPLDVPLSADLTVYGDTHPQERPCVGETVMFCGELWKVTGIADEGISVTYRLEPVPWAALAQRLAGALRDREARHDPAQG